MRFLNKVLVLLIIGLLPNYLLAQKLSSVQGSSLLIPDNIKIDGKSDDWNGKYQAYNHSVELFYTIANDRDNLYFIIHAEKPRIIQKIMLEGIYLVINSTGKKSDNDVKNVSFTYPQLSFKGASSIIYNTRNIEYNPGTHLHPGYDTTLADAGQKQIDSSIYVANKRFVSEAKTIKVKNVDATKDTLLSIYNEEGIKAQGSFDEKGTYTYEIIMPIKYIGISENKQQAIGYSIKLKGRTPKRGMITHYIYQNGQAVNLDNDLDSTTSFWAQYVLTKVEKL